MPSRVTDTNIRVIRPGGHKTLPYERTRQNATARHDLQGTSPGQTRRFGSGHRTTNARILNPTLLLPNPYSKYPISSEASQRKTAKPTTS